MTPKEKVVQFVTPTFPLVSVVRIDTPFALRLGPTTPASLFWPKSLPSFGGVVTNRAFAVAIGDDLKLVLHLVPQFTDVTNNANHPVLAFDGLQRF